MDEEDGNQHFAWACNIILPVICLQVADPKGKMRHHTKKLEERLNKIDAGEMEDVCNETKRIQRALLARSKPSKGTNQKKKNTGGNWITEARRHVTTGEIRRAKRCIEEDQQSMEPISNDTFNKLAAMFPPRKKPDILLPPPDPNATKYAHINAQQVRESIMELQGSGGISHIDAKAYRKVLSSKACIPESKSMCEAISKICNSLATKEISPEITAPMRAVRIIALSKTDGGIRPIGV